MLKIGTVRWRGKCSRHPMFDPLEGRGAVRGGCERCLSLIEILETHQKMMALMRTFAPPPEKKRKPEPLSSRQIGLFEEE